MSKSIRGEMMPLSVGSVHILNKKDLILWCDIYIPSGWMFNLLWLRDTTQKLTDTWNFNVRCGFREYCSHKKAKPLHWFSSFELYRKTCCKSAPAAHLVPGASNSAAFRFFMKLFILRESALLITANDTDIRRRRALFNNESTFLSPGGDVTNYTLLIHWNKLLLVFFQANKGQKISPMSPKQDLQEIIMTTMWVLSVNYIGWILFFLNGMWKFQENKYSSQRFYIKKVPQIVIIIS